MKYLKKIDSAKIYMSAGQIIYMSIGYITQVLLSKVILSNELFSQFQFVNFLTNIFNFFIATSIPIILAREVAKKEDKVSKDTEFITAAKVTFKYTLLQLLVVVIMSAILLTASAFDSNVFILVILSMIQVFAFGLMNLTNLYFVGQRKIKTFFYTYVGYIFIKSSFILVTAVLTQNVKFILLFIIIAELVQVIINTLIISPKIDFKKLNTLDEKKYGNFIDLMFANLVMFGLTNFSVVISFLGLNNGHAAFNIYTLVFPWTLISFYIISSVGNIYIVDFASGKVIKKDIWNILKKIFLVALGISIFSFIGGTIFFSIFYKDNLNDALFFLAVAIPSGIIISLISTLISIYQGLNETKDIRWITILVVLIYIVITFINSDLRFIAVFTTLSYLVILALMLLNLKLNNKKSV